MTLFQVKLSFKGKTFVLDNVTTSVSSRELHSRALAALDLPEGGSVLLKLLYKGKRLPTDGTDAAFASVPSKTPKILVMASSSEDVSTVATKKSDPTIRGFDQERQRSQALAAASSTSVWGPLHASQDKTYKFGRLVACTWQSFGHRPTEQTPHAFEAMRLLERMVTDPGVVAILRERELFVGTLGEMDPIDDRLMQQKEQEGGGCLLGYNTNGGLRIDVKLRTDDLRGFRPYADLVSTLIHELSHNWVSDHNLLFWTNFGQMRAEYLHTHASLRSHVVDGQTTAALAGLRPPDLDDVLGFVVRELTVDMAQHGLHPRMIAAPLQQRCRELEQRPTGHKLGRGGASSSLLSRNNHNNNGKNARELALAAAERRSRQQQQQRNQRLDDDETMQ